MPVPLAVRLKAIRFRKEPHLSSMKVSFKVGDKLVYPNHGVTVVEHIGESAIMPTGDSYYHLRLLATNSRLMVPITNQDRVGLRRLYQQKEVKGLLGLLEEKPAKSHTDWKGRYRENLEKMKTGRLEDEIGRASCRERVENRAGRV